ncbi:MAG: tripartite tricarboxylate transporter TctB family protein [Dehalococcoidia bacterium]
MRALWAPFIEGIFWVALAGVAYALTYQFDEPLPQYRYGATGWPRVLLVAIALFAMVQTTSSLLTYCRRGGMGQMERQRPGRPSDGPATGILLNLKRLGAFAVPLVYLFLMPRMGYYIITPFFLAGYMRLLGERRLVHLVGTTLLIFVLTLIVFTKLLFVSLPIGNWPGFYELNSLFLSFIK